jgi:amino acid transporter
MDTSTQGARAELKRGEIGLAGVLITGVAVMAPAAAIFLGAAVLGGIAGSSVPLIFAIAAVALLATGNSLARFTRAWPSAGSFVTFISRTLGGTLGLFTASAVLLGVALAYGGTYVFIGQWLAGEFFGAPTWMTLLFVGVVLVPVIRGVNMSVKVALTLVAIEVVVIMIITLGILFSGGSDGISFDPFTLPGGFEPVALGLAFTIFLFAGFEDCVPLAEESKDPRRTVPRAIFISIIGIGIILVLTSWALVLAFGDGATLSQQADPLGTAADEYANVVSGLVPWIILSSFLGFGVAANNAWARVVFNTAREGLLPAPLAKLHPQWRTPWVATLAFAIPSVVVGLGATIFATPEEVVGLFTTAGTLLIILMYALVNLALIVCWSRARSRGTGEDWGGPFGSVVVPLVGIAVLLLPFYYNLKPGQVAPLDLTWLFLLGIVVLAGAYTLYVRSRRPELVESAGSILAGESAETAESRGGGALLGTEPTPEPGRP